MYGDEAPSAAAPAPKRDRPAPPKEPDSPVARVIPYEILDAEGVLVAVHERVEFENGKKVFRWSRDGKSGLGGLPVGDVPLYGAQFLRENPTARVILTEGEKAAEACWSRGELAVGTTTGASACPSLLALEVLRGRDVVLWEDNDDAGRGHMKAARSLLKRIAGSIRTISWPGAPEKGDAADFRGTDEEFHALVDASKSDPLRFRLRGVNDLGSEDALSWIWKGYLAKDSILLLSGKPKAGKSTLVYDLIAHMERGHVFCGMPTERAKAIVLTEEGSRTVKKKCERFGIEQAVFVTRQDFKPDVPFRQYVEGCVQTARVTGAKVLVVDTFARWARLGKDGEKDAGATGEAMEPLLWAAGQGVAVIMVHHTTKGDSAQDSADGHRGSGNILASVEVGVIFKKYDPMNPKDTRRVLVADSREDDTPGTLVVRLEADRFVGEGDREDAEKKSLAEKIISTLRTEATWFLFDTIRSELRVRRETLTETLAELVSAGVIRRHGGTGTQKLRFALSSHAITEPAEDSRKAPPAKSGGKASEDALPF